ncbi:MAG: hypothetical protein WC975_00190 [Phycisphaerae bacterium]
MLKKTILLLVACAFIVTCTGCNAVSIVSQSLGLAAGIVSLFV